MNTCVPPSLRYLKNWAFVLAILLGGWWQTSPLCAGPVPQLGVYRWSAPDGPNKVNVYCSWLGRDDVWAEDFLASDDWFQISGAVMPSGGSWVLNPWRTWVTAKSGRRLILGVPMLPSGDPNDPNPTLELGAAGAYNSYYSTLAANLISKDLGNSIIRLGHEFNGGWYKWAANGKAGAYAGYWRAIVDAMRKNPDGTPRAGANFKFCWNPARGYLQFPAEQAYPGDAYVDYIALDVYDESWVPGTYPFPAGASAAEIENRRQLVWEDILNGNHGIVFWQNFAAQHGKPFAFGEWGVSRRDGGNGGDDNAAFIQNMYDYFTSHDVAWAVYFDVQAGDGHHQLSTPIPAGTADFPLARAKYIQLFGKTATTSEAETLSRTVTSPLTVSIFGEAAASAGQAIRLNSTAAGQFINFTVPVTYGGPYAIKVRFKGFSSRGKCQMSINGINQGGETDLYNSAGVWFERDFGSAVFSSGSSNSFRFTVTGKNAASAGYDLAFDYIKLVPMIPSNHEVEDIQTAIASDSISLISETSASGGEIERLNSNAINDYVTYTVPLAQAGTYTVNVRVKRSTSRGKFQLSIDGVNQGAVQDLYSTVYNDYVQFSLGTKTFATSGDKNFTFLVTGKNSASSGYDLAFDCIKLTP